MAQLVVNGMFLDPEEFEAKQNSKGEVVVTSKKKAPAKTAAKKSTAKKTTRKRK
jgi:hypothetical protein